MSVLQQTVSLAAQPRASSSLSSSSRTSRQLQESPPQARYRLKPMSLMIDRFFLSRLESLCESFKSSEGGQRRDCVLCSVPLSLHSANPTDSPSLASMLVGQYFYSDAGASGGVTLISRIKVVRPPPAAGYALAPCGICGQFSHLPCRRENRPQTPQANTHSPA